MADEDHVPEAERLDHRLHIAGQAGCTPDLAVLPRFAAPRLVEGDDAVIGGEGADLVLPVFAVRAPAVQEDEGRVALTPDLANETQPIAGTDGLLGKWAFCSGWEPVSNCLETATRAPSGQKSPSECLGADGIEFSFHATETLQPSLLYASLSD